MDGIWTGETAVVDIVNSAERLLRLDGLGVEALVAEEVDIVNSAERLLRLGGDIVSEDPLVAVDIVNSAERLLRPEGASYLMNDQLRSISSIQPKGF